MNNTFLPRCSTRVCIRPARSGSSKSGGNTDSTLTKAFRLEFPAERIFEPTHRDPNPTRCRGGRHLLGQSKRSSIVEDRIFHVGHSGSAWNIRSNPPPPQSRGASSGPRPTSPPGGIRCHEGSSAAALRTDGRSASGKPRAPPGLRRADSPIRGRASRVRPDRRCSQHRPPDRG